MKHPVIFGALATAAIFGLNLPAARATVAVPEILGDHMVLEQRAECLLWGKGTKPGEKVLVTASWGEKMETTVSRVGRWQVSLHTPAATPLSAGLKSYHIEIIVPNENQIQLRDVLVGEVWLFSGQSNMVMPCGPGHPSGWCAWYGEATWSRDRAKADRPGMRLFNVEQAAAADPQFDCKSLIPGLGILPPGPDGIVPAPARGWQVCTPEIADGFSAVAYHMGATLQERLDVPVGLVVSACGGTSISPWISLAGQRGFTGRTAPRDEATMSTAGALYNAMISPVLLLRVAGICWYQGESNVGTPAELYARLLRALIVDWRRAAGNPALPFYYVQLASVVRNGGDAWGDVREAQAEVQDDPHVGMVVISDQSEPRNIHPRYKHEVGARLARLALARTYGCTGVAADFPRATAARAEGGAIRVFFAHANGLRTRDGQAPGYFEVAGADGAFKPASAKIDGETVMVNCSAVSRPATIRFGWGSSDMPNLVEAGGYPVGQFRLGVNP